MKDIGMGAALVRQWVLLSLLPRPPQKIDAATLEARLRDRGHAIHRRTIQRDLVELASVFPIVADERSKPYGWRWSEAAPAQALLCPPMRLSAAPEPPRMHVEVRAAASVVAEVAALLRLERPPPGVVARGSVDDTPRTRRVLLAYAGEIELVAPRHLREELRRRARAFVERHGCEPLDERGGRDEGRMQAREQG